MAVKSLILDKLGLIALFVSTFCLYFLAFHYDFDIHGIPVFNIIVGDRVNSHVGNGSKKILFWNEMFGDNTFYLGEGDIFADCPVNNCYATHSRTYGDIMNYDAILFHGNELDYFDLPKMRDPKQWYVYVNLESPENRPLIDPFYEDYFNLTMTYRLDSDLPWTYGVVEKVENGGIVAPLVNVHWNDYLEESAGNRQLEKEPEESSLSKTIQGKRRLVCWFVSNCPAKSGRLEYVKELSKHIIVDIYGECGEHRCPRNRDCFAEIVEPDCFFYLSFENSLCRDYVTEKLYNPLRYNVVPIVYGGANYSLFAPPGSYVNAMDFDTPKDLAEYLKNLAKNPQEYRKYFRWKRYYKIDTGVHRIACKLCEFFNSNNERKTYYPLSNWYSKGKCPLQRFIDENQQYLTGAVLKNRN